MGRHFLFPTTSRAAVGPTQPPIQCVPYIKCPGRKADTSPQANAKARNAWSFSSTPSYVFITWHCYSEYFRNRWANFRLFPMTGFELGSSWLQIRCINACYSWSVCQFLISWDPIIEVRKEAESIKVDGEICIWAQAFNAVCILFPEIHTLGLWSSGLWHCIML
jgi:hypothetical protein